MAGASALPKSKDGDEEQEARRERARTRFSNATVPSYARRRLRRGRLILAESEGASAFMLLASLASARSGWRVSKAGGDETSALYSPYYWLAEAHPWRA